MGRSSLFFFAMIECASRQLLDHVSNASRHRYPVNCLLHDLPSLVMPLKKQPHQFNITIHTSASWYLQVQHLTFQKPQMSCITNIKGYNIRCLRRLVILWAFHLECHPSPFFIQVFSLLKRKSGVLISMMNEDGIPVGVSISHPFC